MDPNTYDGLLAQLLARKTPEELEAIFASALYDAESSHLQAFSRTRLPRVATGRPISQPPASQPPLPAAPSVPAPGPSTVGAAAGPGPPQPQVGTAPSPFPTYAPVTILNAAALTAANQPPPTSKGKGGGKNKSGGARRRPSRKDAVDDGGIDNVSDMMSNLSVQDDEISEAWGDVHAEDAPAQVSAPAGAAAVSPNAPLRQPQLTGARPKSYAPKGQSSTAGWVPQAVPQVPSTQAPLSSQADAIPSDVKPAAGGFAKCGDHSVYERRLAMENVCVDADDEALQNVITYLRNNTGLKMTSPDWYQLGNHLGWGFMSDVNITAGHNGAQRSGTCYAWFARMAKTAVAQWNIYFDDPVREIVYDMAEVEAYMTGRVVDARKVGSNIRTMYNMPAPLSEMLGDRLNRSRYKCDNSAFYVYCILNALQLHDYSKLGVIPTATARAVGTHVNRDFSAAGIGAALFEDLDTGRIVIDSSRVNTESMGVLCTVANGFPAWTTPQAATAHYHVLESLQAPPIPIAIYSATATAIPVVAPTDPQQYLDVAVAMAQMRKELPDLARAYVRASSIINGKVHKTSATQGAPDVFEMCTLERYKTTLVRPFDSNWMWHRLGITPNVSMAGNFIPEELGHVTHLQIEEVQKVGITISALISVGIGTILNFNNIGGQELNQAITPSPVASGLQGWLSWYLDTDEEVGQPAIFRGMCGFLSRTTPVIIHPTCFPMKTWSHRRSTWPNPVDFTTKWAYSYDWKIPYQVDPLATLPWFDLFHPCWGVLEAGPSIDVSEGMTKFHNPVFQVMWDDEGNTSGYFKAANSQQPYTHIPHFNLALNCYMQQFMVNGPVVNFRPFVLSLQGRPHPNVPALPAGTYQPEYDATKYMCKVGSVRTYCWTRGTVIVPYITSLNARAIHDLGQW